VGKLPFYGAIVDGLITWRRSAEAKLPDMGLLEKALLSIDVID